MSTSMPSPASPQLAEPVRRALIAAREEAVRLRHPYVGTEHLLLGLVRLDDPTVRRLWVSGEVKAEALAPMVEEALRPGDERHAIDNPDALPYTSLGRKVVEQMMNEVAMAGQVVAQPAHLLLALVSDERGIAGRICRKAGLTVGGVRAVAGELSAAGRPAPLVALDDRSDRPISDQIVRQIQEQVATGALAAGQRLPPVRRLADLLDIAPGTVARAYTELERLGVVVTDGARGTWVAERRAPSDTHDSTPDELVHLLRPVVITAYHLGASAQQMRETLEVAMRDIFDDGSTAVA